MGQLIEVIHGLSFPVHKLHFLNVGSLTGILMEVLRPMDCIDRVIYLLFISSRRPIHKVDLDHITWNLQWNFRYTFSCNKGNFPQKETLE